MRAGRGRRVPAAAGGLAALVLVVPGCTATAPAGPLRVRVPPAPPAVIHARVVRRARAAGYTVEAADLARGPVRIRAMTDEVGLVEGRPLARTRSAFLVRADPDGTVWIHAVGDGVDLRRGRMSAALRRELEALGRLLAGSPGDDGLSSASAGEEAGPPRGPEGP